MANQYGGAVNCYGANIILIDCSFIGNNASTNGGAIDWSGNNGTLIGSNFIINRATGSGGAIMLYSSNFTLINSIFIDNIADSNGGAIYWLNAGHLVNCTFLNDKWIKSNGIYANNNLTINGGKGIVNIITSSTLLGISIVVLNNETYYYPPNTNINLPNNKQRIP